MHPVEDPKSIDDFGVLPMIQNLELHANWIFYQLLWLEVDRPGAEAESHCERRGQKGPGARYSGVYHTADSEASDTESPRFEDVAGAEVQY